MMSERMHPGLRVIRVFAMKMIFLHCLVLFNILLVIAFDAFSHTGEVLCSIDGLEQNCVILNLERPVAFFPSVFPILAVLSVALFGSLYNIIFSTVMIFLATFCVSRAIHCVAFILGIIPYLMVLTSKVIALALLFVAYEMAFDVFEDEDHGAVSLFLAVAASAIFLLSLIASNTTGKAVSKMLDDLEDEVFGDNLLEGFHLVRVRTQLTEETAQHKKLLKKFLYYFGRDRHPAEL